MLPRTNFVGDTQKNFDSGLCNYGLTLLYETKILYDIFGNCGETYRNKVAQPLGVVVNDTFDLSNLTRLCKLVYSLEETTLIFNAKYSIGAFSFCYLTIPSKVSHHHFPIDH